MTVLTAPIQVPCGLQHELAPAALEAAQLNDQDLSVTDLGNALPGGELNGPGTLVFKSGATYQGDLLASSIHGQGSVTFKDGLRYTGSFSNNVIHGSGTYQWPGGGQYDGEVCEGLRHGHGHMTFTDSPVVYEGSWCRGKRHGRGKITLNAGGTHWYEGDWVDDKKCGQGVMRYANGDRYSGVWSEDVKCGGGIMEWTSRKQRYEGQWARNLPNGPGTHVWYQQLVTEPTPANHAMLVLFNRYEGHFKDGKRHGYGVLYYATGARYEGLWEADLKQGPGIFVFENGEVWQGQFANDQPVLSDGEVFAPKGPGVCLQVDDLADEEEVPAAAARGLANVLMVYNTDLRGLYDKYCKRPSLHLKEKNRPCFTMVTCQVWELLGDVRLITAATPLARCNQLLAKARRPAHALDAFRRRMRACTCDQSDSVDVAWWDGLVHEHVRGGEHAPMQELLFREFCEFLVRLAAVRYRHIPLLERRLHTLINVHLLHQVSKNKATLPPPPRTPFHMEMWAGNATSVLHASDTLLRAAWARIGTTITLQPPTEPPAEASETEVPASAVVSQLSEEDAGATAQQAEECDPGSAAGVQAPVDLAEVLGPVPSDDQLYSQVHSVRSAVQLLQGLRLLAGPAEAMQAAAAMAYHYLTINTYTYEPHRPRVEMEDTGVQAAESSGAEPAADSEGAVPALSDADTREVLCWLDQPLLYADWVEGLARVAQTLVQVPKPPQEALEEGTRDGDAAGLSMDGAGSPIQGAEGVLHQQLGLFLTGGQGLQQAMMNVVRE